MNTITQILPWIQVGCAILLIALVLLQRSTDGIEGALGGSSTHMTHFSRRGAERFLFNATIVIAIIFSVSVALSLILSQV